MNKLLTLCFLLFGLAAGSQDLSFQPAGVRTRAVVVGISRYQDEGIGKLSYAHRDAEVFAEFLKSKSGGGLKNSDIRLLRNEEATLARMQAALEWLLKKAKPGEQAIIYFAGHGDVETKNEEEKGYLLAYDTPYNNYRLNALSLDYLNQDIVDKLSEKEVKVIVITDACHSGALAGKDAGGRQATAAELMKRFSNEVKIMSCQPYELSMEEKSLGGGRGVFSYYLVNGLNGWADKDRNQKVDLYELEGFLQDSVRRETGKTQHPDIFGGFKQESLFWVDEATMAKIKAAEKTALEQNFEEDVLLRLATRESQNNYVDFLEALKKGRLASPESRSAIYYYDILYADTTFIPLRSIIDEKLTIALMDSVQQAINAYLRTDPGELAQRVQFDQKYNRFPEYLKKAVEILGPQDPRYRPTLAKQFYFEGLVLRLEAEQRGGSDSLYQLALEKQEKALEQEGRAAYIHNELGVLLPELGRAEEGMGHLRKAIEISPTWAIPHNNLAVEYKRAGRLEEAKHNYLKAIEYKPDFSSAYSNLGNLLAKQENYDSAELMYRKGIELGPAYKDNYFNLGLLLSGSDEAENKTEAKAMFNTVLRLAPDYPEAYFELGNLYDAMEQPDSAEIMYLNAIGQKPDYVNAYLNLGLSYFNQGRLDEAEKMFQEAARSAPDNPEAYRYLGLLYYNQDRPEEAERKFLEAIRASPDYTPVYANLGFLYGEQGEWEKTTTLIQAAPLDTAARIEVYDEIGSTAYQSERHDIAIAAFQTATTLDPAEPWYYYLMCGIFALDGKEGEALDMLEETLEKAHLAGQDYFEQVTEDTDLDALRQSNGYKTVMTQYFPDRYK